jgi:molybdopterin-binding protein
MINSFVPIETPNGSEVTVKVTIAQSRQLLSLPVASRVAAAASASLP